MILKPSDHIQRPTFVEQSIIASGVCHNVVSLLGKTLSCTVFLHVVRNIEDRSVPAFYGMGPPRELERQPYMG